MIYTLTRASIDDLDTPLIEMPNGLGSPAFPIFKSESTARAYLDAVCKGQDLVVAELAGLALLELVHHLRGEGIEAIIVDPPLILEADGSAQSVPTRHLAEAAATAITEAIGGVGAGQPRILNPRLILSCAECGAVQRVNPDETLPYCCGAVMRISGQDSKPPPDKPFSLA